MMRLIKTDPRSMKGAMIEEKPISIRKFARMRNVAHPSVINWINTGRIQKGVVVPNPKTGHRKIIASIAIEELNQTDDPDKDHLRENGGGSPPERAAGGSAAIPALAKIKAQKEAILMQKAAIELRKMKGELVEKENVYNTLFEFGKLLRENILAIPDRLADEVFAAKTRAEVHRVLSEALNRALEDLSDADKLNL